MSFNPKEYYVAKPNERFAISFYYQRQRIMEAQNDNQYLKEIRKLEADLVNCYEPPPINQKITKPHSAGYLDWRRKLREKVKKEGIKNSFAIGITIYKELMHIANEAGLIGGNDRIGTGVVTEGEKLDIDTTEEEV